MYKIRIGELFIYDIYTTYNSPETNFITGLNLKSKEYEEYTLEKGQALIKILSELGIEAFMVEIEKEREINELNS